MGCCDTVGCHTQVSQCVCMRLQGTELPQGSIALAFTWEHFSAALKKQGQAQESQLHWAQQCRAHSTKVRRIAGLR